MSKYSDDKARREAEEKLRKERELRKKYIEDEAQRQRVIKRERNRRDRNRGKKSH